MSLTVGTNTWATLVEAETYMLLRLNANAVWDDDLAEEEKDKALATAYRQFNADNRFALPETADQNMKDGQCEQALFLLFNQGDVDSRSGIQSMGVTSSAVVGEVYGDDPKRVPISLQAGDLMRDYRTNDGYMGAVDLLQDRDCG